MTLAAAVFALACSCAAAQTVQPTPVAPNRVGASLPSRPALQPAVPAALPGGVPARLPGGVPATLPGGVPATLPGGLPQAIGQPGAGTPSTGPTGGWVPAQPGMRPVPAQDPALERRLDQEVARCEAQTDLAVRQQCRDWLAQQGRVVR